MEDEIHNNNIIRLGKLLLQKGIEFCLYRHPDSEFFNIATQKELLPESAKINFIIAPFNNKEHELVLLRKIPKEVLTNHRFTNKIQQLNDSPINWGTLPESTGKEVYLERIHQYLKFIKDKKALKAILSRVKILGKPYDFDPFIFYQKLSSAYPETFTSLFYIPGKGIWTGASPELFLEKEKNHFYTVALAATLPKSPNKNYKWGKKDKEEHNMVRQHIEAVFANNNCKLIKATGPYSFETGKVAHLKTDYVYEQANNKYPDKIINELFPTPAIGGLPVDSALTCIRLYEGYSRHFYSGYLGETNGIDLARLFINLRCMQIGCNKIAVFVGGGISDGSDPEDEWEETIQKSLTLLEIIEESIPGELNKNEVIR